MYNNSSGGKSPMSELGTFFRHCPSCGRRFEIKLVSKKLIDDTSEAREEKEVSLNPGYRAVGKVVGVGPTPTTGDAPRPTMGRLFPLSEDVAVVSDTKGVLYTYKCKKCGHEWSEERFKTAEEKTKEDYAGD
jgi:predicted RNA-binding Zn-ribbon protein involved in translation (DUF1610 family)